MFSSPNQSPLYIRDVIFNESYFPFNQPQSLVTPPYSTPSNVSILGSPTIDWLQPNP